MAHYRLYFMQSGGGIEKAVDLDCANDAAAVEKASGFRHAPATELWQGSRLVNGLSLRPIVRLDLHRHSRARPL